jgi:DNA polymerase-1
MRYLDVKGLTLTGDPTAYASALGIEYDSTDIPTSLSPGDVIITGPWGAKEWSWLSSYIIVEIVPDGGELERVDPLTHALKRRGLPTTYRKKPPTPKSRNYNAYLAAVAEAEERERPGFNIDMGSSGIPYSVVTDPVEAVGIIRSLYNKPFSFDYETDGLDPHTAQIVGLALADEHHAWFIARQGLNALPELGQLLRHNSSIVSASNSKFELKVSAVQFGCETTDFVPIWDTQVMHWVWQCGSSLSRENDLKSLTKRLLKRDVLTFESVVPRGTSIWDVPVEILARYAAAGDARNTYDLVPILRKHLTETGLLHVYRDIELPLTPVLADMELQGLNISLDTLQEMAVDLIQRKHMYEAAIRDLGFKGNIKSSEQLATWLYRDLGLPVLTTTEKSGRGRTDTATLKQLEEYHVAVPLIIRLSECEKLLNTFIMPRLHAQSDKLYASINQTSTFTGRLSSSDPNIQNWPLEMHKVIVAPPGDYEIGADDFSQIEPRIAAVASNDANMLAPYLEPPYLADGTPNPAADPYIQLGLRINSIDPAKVLSKEKRTRTMIKAAYLGCLMYGGGAAKIQEILRNEGHIVPLSTCHEIKSSIERHLARFMEWRQEVIQQARASGSSWTMYGRRRIMAPKIWSKDPNLRAEAEREAVNVVPQGTAADIIKKCMPQVHRLVRQAGGRLINQVHDELVRWAPTAVRDELAHELRKVMEENEVFPLRVEGGTGYSWYDAKPK